MSQTLTLIFENGVFRPLEPISLRENEIITVVVAPRPESACNDSGTTLTRQRQALAEMFAEADALPLEAADDGFSGADHDLVLYGWKRQ